MADKIQRDRAAVPALDELLQHTADARLAQLADQLATGLSPRGQRAERQRAVIRLALDFWTWRRLDREGLDDTAAATAISNTAVCAS